MSKRGLVICLILTFIVSSGLNQTNFVYGAAPITQASNVLISNDGAASADISWINGNGSQRAVFMKQGNSGSASPINGTIYTANARFADGTQLGISDWYCIYNGTGTNVTVTGLMPATDYIVSVCEYNGTAGNEEYLTATINNTNTITMKDIIINEIDSDTPGTDTKEFIELFDGGSGFTKLDGLTLVLYNGGTNCSYYAYDLDGYQTTSNGYFVLGNSFVDNVNLIFGNSILQNGADAIALYFENGVEFPNGTIVTINNLVDAIVYDTDDGDDAELLALLAPGQNQINEGGNGNKENHSLQRLPNGTGGKRITDSYFAMTPTPGAENKAPGFTVTESDGSTRVTEVGSTDTFTIVLDARPTLDVVFDITSGDASEATVNQVTVTFAPENWNSPQTIIVTGVDDNRDDGDQTTSVTVSVNDSSSDDSFDTLTNKIVSVTTTDDDVAGFTIVESDGNTTVAESGTQDAFTIVLDAQPDSDVVLNINSSDIGEITLQPSTVTYTNANWNAPQTVTITGVDDNLDDGDQSTTITVSVDAANSDDVFDAVSDQTVSVTTTDDDDGSEINVKGNSISITNGDTTPQTADHTYFGSVNVNSGTITRTYTIENIGLLDLNLDGTPEVAIRGTHVSDFTVITPPESSIVSGGTTTFTVAFDPTVSGTRTATISIGNDDYDENPYEFTIQGKGTIPASTPTLNPSTSEPITNEDGSVTITVEEPKVDKETGEAKVKLSIDDIDKAFGKTELNKEGKKKIKLEIPKAEGAEGYQIELPKVVLESDKKKEIGIMTHIGTATLPGNMLENEESEDSGSISLSFKKVIKEELDEELKGKIGDRPVIEINLIENGKIKPWKNENAPVTLSIPYTLKDGEDSENIVVWYIGYEYDENGNVKQVELPVTNGRFNRETGMVEFDVTHFSTYGIVYVEKTFDDLDTHLWAKHQIEVLASKGIINGTSLKTYSPGNLITRADFLLLLVKTLGLTAEVDSNFSDIQPTAYYYEAVGIAKKLGITTGVGNNMFKPKESITRQDMMVLTEKALRISGKLTEMGDITDLNRFKDKKEIVTYAVDSIAVLVKKGLILGSNNMINPQGNTTRAEIAVLLYNIYNGQF